MSVPAHILVVDDNASNRKLLAYLLRAQGYVVSVAESSEEASLCLGSHRANLILMDLQLPGVDGLTFTRQLKADPTTRDIPIVAVTAYAMKGDEARARAAGCDGYITKPIDTRALPKTIAEHLARLAPGATPCP